MHAHVNRTQVEVMKMLMPLLAPAAGVVTLVCLTHTHNFDQSMHI